jgi:hypothetical protein
MLGPGVAPPLTPYRLVIACTLLAIFASASWSIQIDDIYISYTYADQWVNHGGIQWQTGERVEGYSNFLWVGAMALGILLHVPPGIWVKGLSFLSGVGVLALFDRWLPRTPAGTAILLALSVWDPLGWWAPSGMETVTAGLVLALGWRALMRDEWSRAMGWLVVFNLLRPEGMLLVAVGVLRRIVRSRGPWAGGAAAVGLLVLYHLGRVAWFGSFWPTPYLVKLVQPAKLVDGLVEVGGDWLGMLPVVGLAALAFQRLAWRDVAWIALPVALPSVLLVKAGGDWMGHGRWILPGFLASLSGLAAVAAPRAVAVREWAYALVIPTALVCSDSLLLGGLRLRDAPVPQVPPYLQTPQEHDLAWLVEHAPDGARVQLDDVGMVSLVPDIGILDNYGLVDRAVALAAAGWDSSQVEARHTGEDPLDCIRSITVGERRPAPLPDRLQALYPYRQELQNGSGWSAWSCREPVCPDPVVCQERAARRWAALFEKAPDQPFLRLQHARSLAQAGRWAEAESLMASWLTPDDADALLLVDHGLEWEPSRGFVFETGGCYSTRSLDRPVSLRLDADNPGAEGALVDIAWRCGDEWEKALALAVVAPTTRTLRPMRCGTAPSLQICYLNDSTEGADRNFYVRADPAWQ